MFGDKPKVSPVCTIGSNDSNGDQTVEDWAVDDPDAENEESEEPEETRKAQKRSANVTETNGDSKREGTKKQEVERKTQVSEVLEYLEKEASLRAKKKEESKKERRHEERMYMFQQLFTVLKDKKD